jgi:serine/threonine protein kinase
MFACCARRQPVQTRDEFEITGSISNPIVEIDPFADEDEAPLGDVEFVNEYKLVRTLGKGAMGIVKLGETSGAQYAIKCMSKSALSGQRDSHREGRKWIVRTGLDKVKMEIAIMKKMHHPNVVKFYEVAPSAVERVVY